MNFVDTIQLRKNAGFGAIKVVTRDEISCRKQLAEVGGHLRLDVYDATTESKDIPERLADVELYVGWDARIERNGKARRFLVHRASAARKEGKLLVLLGAGSELHEELRDVFSVVKHPLTAPEEHAAHFLALVKEAGLDVDMESALNAVRGLTATRQEDAFALGIVDAKRRGLPKVNLGVLRRYKEQEIGDLGYLKVREPGVSFNDLIGHDYLKEWLHRRKLGFTQAAREAGLPYPRGLLAVGPPGTGKSRLAEATAFEWGCPYLMLDVGAAMGSYLGESEGNINHALAVAERVSPCVLLVDEVDYALGGSGDRDGGTTGRIVGKVLTWLATKTEPVFVFFTSNRPWVLPPAMTRKGRLDEIFCVDFPSEDEREGIFGHYLGHALGDVLSDEMLEATRGWSGAEIEAAVDGARFKAFADGRSIGARDLEEEIRLTTPVAVSQEDDVSKMREWARSFARSSQKGEQDD